MKVISYNVRGLGGFEKRAEVRCLVQDKQPVVLCLQESKLNVLDEFFTKSLWGGAPCGYSYQASIGASGGLVTIWDTSAVEVWCTYSFRHVLIIEGRVLATGQEFFIANVYAPCDTSAKQVLWNNISNFILNIGDVSLCICGDFNSVRSEAKRKGKSAVFRQLDADNFNNFIENSFLIDLPLYGRLFT